ncbi:MAG: hypothetical protein J1F66_04300 [Clostridiales bacterium]|nr:hypothetical protein [Clostridiales bacterium]
MCLKLITDDLFDIAARLRTVKESYVVYYNTEKERFEVHDKRGCLEFVVPYDELDARTVEYARYSRVENAKRIFADVEEYNNRLEKTQAQKTIERAAVAYEDVRRMNEG